MALKARYDPKADRMRLMLHPADHPPLLFWVTRRQWLGLLRRLRVVAQQLGVELSAPKPVQAPRHRLPKNPEVESLAPASIDKIGLRVEGRGARLHLLAGGCATGLSLNPATLRELEELVALQAERAGWDPRAAMQRLEANEVVRDALNRVGRQSEES